MLAPTQICSHVDCFTRTNAQTRVKPHMGGDFFPRSVLSSGEPTSQLSAVLRQFPDQPLPEVTSTAPSISRRLAAAYPPSISITSIFLEHNSYYTSSPLPCFILSTCSNQSTLTTFPFVRQLPPSLAGTTKLR